MKLSIYLLFLLTLSFATAKTKVCGQEIDPKKDTICYATINSDNEKKVFMSKTSDQFNHFELTQCEDPDQPNSWFEKACDQKEVECSSLVISGHFAGDFIGHHGLTLHTHEMERRSCQKSCQNILSKPAEVYLFGCNTLAGKDDRSSRSEPEYREALENPEYGLSPTQIDQVVQSRLGLLGDSMKNKMPRIFKGVPVIHGFKDKSPLGHQIEKYLDKYLIDVNKDGGYQQRLERLQSKKLTNLIQQFQDPMKNFAVTACSALESGDVKQKKIRENICLLHDTRNLKAKITTLQNMLVTDSIAHPEIFHAYLPIAANFIRENELNYKKDPDLYQELIEAIATPEINNQISGLIEKLKSSPTIQAELLNLKRILGFISDQDYQKQGKKILTKILKEDIGKNRATLCSLKHDYHLRPKIYKDDLNLSQNDLTKVDNIKALGCLNIADQAITNLVLPVLNKDHSGDKKQTLLREIKELPDNSENIVQFADKNKENFKLAPYAHQVFLYQKTSPKKKKEALGYFTKNPRSSWVLKRYFNKNLKYKNFKIAQELIEETQDKQNRYNALEALFPLIDIYNEDELSYYLSKYIETFKTHGSDRNYASLFYPFILRKHYPKSLKKFLVQMITEGHGFTDEAIYILKKSNLNKEELTKLYQYVHKLKPNKKVAARVRFILEDASLRTKLPPEIIRYIAKYYSVGIDCFPTYKGQKAFVSCQEY